MSHHSRKPRRTHKPTALFSRRGETELRHWLGSERVLLAFDLDGTLVPLVKDFTHVRLARHTQTLLLKLKDSQPVAVVSGREMGDLSKIVGAKKLIFVGNHGLEGVKTLKRKLHVKEWHKTLSLALKGQSGVQIEDKKFSISIHYRNCRHHDLVRKIMFKTIPTLKGPLRVILGKSVFNLIPDFGQNKGWAVVQLQKKYKCKKAIYVGDDVTDEDVFSLNNKSILGIHVGRAAHTAAPYFLRQQKDVARLLKKISEYYR